MKLSLLACILVITTVTVYVQADYKRVCYFTNWAQWRGTLGKYTVDDIDASLCSHLIYAFVQLDNATGSWNLATIEHNDVENYKKFQTLKSSHPGLKTLVAVGGYTHGTERFTALSSTQSNIQEFANISISFLREHEFDGLDLDWEFPGHAESPPEDKQNFTALVKELHKAFSEESRSPGQDRLLLTAAVSVGKHVIEGGYEIPQLSKYLDWFNLMAYDFHGRWDNKAGANAPLYGKDDNDVLSVEWAVQYWLQRGAPKRKLVLGIGTYGQTYTLMNADNNPGAPTTGSGGTEGNYTGAAGFLGYYEICDKITLGWHCAWDDKQKFPYCYMDKEWVGYDNLRSIEMKVHYVMNHSLGGAMVWALDTDDFTGAFCKQGKYPLVSSIKKMLTNTTEDASTTATTQTTKKVTMGKTSSEKTDNQKVTTTNYNQNLLWLLLVLLFIAFLFGTG